MWVGLGLGNDVPEYWQLALGPWIGWGQLGGPGGQVHGGRVHAVVDLLGVGVD